MLSLHLFVIEVLISSDFLLVIDYKTCLLLLTKFCRSMSSHPLLTFCSSTFEKISNTLHYLATVGRTRSLIRPSSLNARYRTHCRGTNTPKNAVYVLSTL